MGGEGPVGQVGAGTVRRRLDIERLQFVDESEQFLDFDPCEVAKASSAWSRNSPAMAGRDRTNFRAAPATSSG